MTLFMNIKKLIIMNLKFNFLKYVVKILYYILNNYFKLYNILINLHILLRLLFLISKFMNYNI